jgi:murein DD-endopeptidase MepM/ murein hydrolase activator NlpD
MASQKTSIENQQYWTQLALQDKFTEAEKLQAEIASLKDQIVVSQQDYEKKLAQLKVRLRTMYENSNSTAYIRMFLGSGNVSELFQRFHYLQDIYKADRRIMSDFQAAKADLQIKQGLTERQASQTRSAIDQTIAQADQLTAEANYTDTLMYQQQVNIEYWRQQEAMFLQQSLFWQKFILQAQNPNSTYSAGLMEWPTPGYGYVTQLFGYFPHPIFGSVMFHSGIDIGAPWGVNIVAATAGTVLYAGYEGGYGNTVIIDHGGGISTLYGHASSLNCYTGQVVARGQTVAYVGSTGLSTGPHLHFEVRVNGSPVNPQDYVVYGY